MESDLSTLKVNLDTTIEAYRDLLESEKAKQCYIIAGRTESIAKVIDQQKDLVARVDGLEQERSVLQAQDDGGRPLRLSEIIAGTEAPLAQQLQERRERLIAITKELEKINRTNYQLLRYSLDMLGEMIGAVFGEPVTPYLYERSGQVTRTSTGGHVLNQAI